MCLCQHHVFVYFLGHIVVFLFFVVAVIFVEYADKLL